MPFKINKYVSEDFNVGENEGIAKPKGKLNKINDYYQL